MNNPSATQAETQDRERGLVSAFVELADTLVEDFDVIEFLHLLSERVIELGLAADAGILLADVDGTLKVVAASQEKVHLLELFQLQNQEGPCLDCYHSGQPVQVEDLETERERWPLFAPRALDAGFRTVHALPLRLRGKILGALNLFGPEPATIDEEADVVARGLADVATIGLLQNSSALHAQNSVEQLQFALNNRITIEQAKGMLSERLGLDMHESFETLRSYARDNGRRLSLVAEDVLGGAITVDQLAARATTL